MSFLRKPITTSQDLSSGALSYTTSVGRNFKLEEVIIHASVAITETITISRDSKQGANYDIAIASKNMVAEQDYFFRPSGECNFIVGDELKVECTDANGTGTVYVELKLSEM